MTVVRSPDPVDNDAKMVEAFLKHLSVHEKEYTRDCYVPNPTTGRYEESPGLKEANNSGAASPEEGRRAPPPTPAALAAAIANTNTPLEPVPEDDSAALMAPARPASSDSWSVVEAPSQIKTSNNINKSPLAAPTEVPSPTSTSSESTTFQVDMDVAADKPSDPVEPSVIKNEEVAKVEKVEEASAPSSFEAADIDADAVAYNAFTFLSASGGNKGLEASKYAKAGSSARNSNSSRALASRDPNINGTPINGYKEKMVQTFRGGADEDETSKSVRFSLDQTEVSTSVETTASVSPKPDGDQIPIATKFPGGSANAPPPAAPTGSQAAPAVASPTSTPAKIESTTETAGEDEDRQNALYSSSWGAPETRSRPLKAQVRSIIIKDLPAALENTQLASLIDGGVIESYRLVKNPTSVFSTAIILFASGAAAKAYYDKYPNGLELKMGGKKIVAIVEMGESVDVVSGVMRGYLESGATRVVRVEGADEDWAMRALRKIAEEKNRKCESIIDTVKEEGRTIEWRFTNIADAVAFRGSLIRDADWEDCNIQFGQDPCARA